MLDIINMHYIICFLNVNDYVIIIVLYYSLKAVEYYCSYGIIYSNALQNNTECY